MIQEAYQKIIDVCENTLFQLREQNDKIIIVLDNCKEWLATIKFKCKDNQNLVTISDTDEFRSFIHENGCSKMYIDINMENQNGIDLAEELGLKDCCGELFFTSNEEPSAEDFARIDKLGANFVSKSIVLKKIIYPKG
jgi:two-component SAPR family response regulator